MSVSRIDEALASNAVAPARADSCLIPFGFFLKEHPAMKDAIPAQAWMRAAPLALCSALLVAACHEIPQDARKPFASEVDVKPQTEARFGGDKDKFDAALTKRAGHSDDYEVIGGAKP